jgi:signal transduction histidine kinase/CHASE3 domain sensor protein
MRLRNLAVGLVSRAPARVQTKLLVAFLAMVALIILLGGVGLQVLSGMNARTEELIELQRKIAAYRQVQHDTTRQLYGVATALLSGDQRELDGILRQLSQFGYDLDRLQHVAEGEVDLLASVREDYDRFIAIVTGAVERARAGQVQEARAVQLNEARPLADRLERLTNQLVNVAEADMLEQIEASQRAYDASRLAVVAFALGSIILALGLCYIFSWSIVAPLTAIAGRLRRIAGGEFAERIDVANRDELGALAVDVNRTSAELGSLYQQIEEALEQQTASSEVLNVISRSTSALQPVLDTIVAIAARLCQADWAVIFRLEPDGRYHLAAASAANDEFVRYVAQNPIASGRGTMVGRTALEGRTVHVPDLLDDPEFTWFEAQAKGNARTVLGVPLLRGNAVIGVINLTRSIVRPFTAKQIELVTTFADQAVIAIENVRLFDEVQARTRELGKALEQQVATSEILRVIASSPTDITPVLNAVAESAAQLCGAVDAQIFRAEGDVLRLAVSFGSIPIHFRERVIDRNWVTGRAVVDRRTVHVADLAAESESEYPAGLAMQRQHGHRTTLATPLLRQGDALGAILIRRMDVDPFTEDQIRLLEAFADQAVIAIENVRLFTQLETRNAELSEALDRQTATSEVLSVISRSTSELQPVLDTIVSTAARLCHAEWANMWRLGADDRYHLAAATGNDQEFLRYLSLTPVIPGRGTVAGRAALEGRTAHVADVLEDPEYSWSEAQAKGSYRTMLGVPLLRGNAVIGVINLTRSIVRPFTAKQIELVTTFADQAVIAIENVRLFDEVQARTRDLTEALEQQTATSAILRVISTSPTDVQPVFETIVRNAVALCGSLFANVFRFDGELLHFVASHNVGRDDAELFRAKYPMSPDSSQVSGRTLLTRSVVRLEDALADPDYDQRFPTAMGWRRMLGVPMLRRGEPLGVIVVGWAEAGPVAKAQEELLKQFADQAVIAIENVRLFDEVQARTRELQRSVSELEALGEISRVISSTLDLRLVLDSILAHACQLADSGGGAIYVYDPARRQFGLEAAYRMGDDLIAAVRAQPMQLGDALVGQCAERREAVQINDLSKAPPHPLYDLHLAAGVRALLAVPLVHQDELIGALVVRRKRVGAFAEDTVGLLQSFAAQSAVAIQNARLFREIEQKGRELEAASRHKSEFLANMSHELRTPLNAVLGYAELIQDGIYGDVPDKMHSVLERIQQNGRHLLGLINDVLDLSKIEAGQLTLSPVDYSMRELVLDVVSATEALVAEKKLALEVDAPADLPHGRGDERRLTQVLLNLVSNAIKFTEAGSVSIRASAADGSFQVAVTDTGVGIAPGDRKRIFEEFQQVDSSSTRKKGGTGLGLAIARRIVELHGGRIWVESTPGHGSTFAFTLPLRVGERERAA